MGEHVADAGYYDYNEDEEEETFLLDPQWEKQQKKVSGIPSHFRIEVNEAALSTPQKMPIMYKIINKHQPKCFQIIHMYIVYNLKIRFNRFLHLASKYGRGVL